MDDIDQYSTESRLRLEVAGAAVRDEVERYVQAVLDLSGRSSERAAMFEAGDRLQAAVELFNDRAFDHTGALPLALRTIDEAEAEAYGADHEAARVAAGRVVSVVSRWDLEIQDPAAVLAAGRAAHMRMYEDEVDDDALVGVDGIGRALYSLAHDAGEIWLQLDDVELVAGARLFVLPAGPAAPLPDDPEGLREWVRAPEGELDFSEGWL